MALLKSYFIALSIIGRWLSRRPEDIGNWFLEELKTKTAYGPGHILG
jgi:hypothetical protein